MKTDPSTDKGSDLAAEAMRRANTFLLAPRDCQRRGCRQSGKCHLRVTADLGFDCGAGLSRLGREIGSLALGLVLDTMAPLQRGIEEAARCAALWHEHRHLIEEDLRARRKPSRKASMSARTGYGAHPRTGRA